MCNLASNFKTRFKYKTLKDLLCRAAMESKVKNFCTHMYRIGRINVDAGNWLEHIPLENWALSHDGGRRYVIITTNMFEVFNGVLINYFTVRRKHGASRHAFGEEFTPYIDAKTKAKDVKTSSHEVLFYDRMQRLFHVQTRCFVGSSNRKPRTYHVNLRTGSCTCNSFVKIPMFSHSYCLSLSFN